MDLRPAGGTLARFPKYSQTTRSAQPVKAMQSRSLAPPVDGGQLIFVFDVVCSLSLMSAILSWKLSIGENIVLYNCALKHDNRTLEQERQTLKI